MADEVGRPKLNPKERRSALIQLRLKPDQKRRFRKAAVRADKSLSDWLVMVAEAASKPVK